MASSKGPEYEASTLEGGGGGVTAVILYRGVKLWLSLITYCGVLDLTFWRGLIKLVLN
jgi:hypothetical protein